MMGREEFRFIDVFVWIEEFFVDREFCSFFGYSCFFRVISNVFSGRVRVGFGGFLVLSLGVF